MKKFKLLLGILLVLFSYNKSLAQWLTTGNLLAGAEKLGSTNAFPVNFYTNNVPRMTIRGQVGPTQGFVGINEGNPLSVLHTSAFSYGTGNLFRTDGNSTGANTWSMYTGPTAATATEKGAIFTGGNANSSPNDFCMRATQSSLLQGGDLVFYTNGNVERLRIKGVGGGGTQPGYIGVNRRFPLSMVHIDGAPASSNPNSTFAAGWRPWMRVGVFSQWDSDGIFVGLKDEGPNKKDAVIAWSDDPGSSNGPDYLRFIFTNNTGATVPQGGGPDGIEAGRWSPLNGYLGIGNFYNSTVSKDPAARLEILPNPLAAINSAIFRLTQIQQNPSSPGTTGLFTDMYTSTTGDLIILPRNNPQINSATMINKNRFVGINTTNPGNTVEINSNLINATAGPGGSGNSGLRFTDLTIASALVTNPGTGVLSVDASGDVIYVPGGGGIGFGYCVSPLPALTNTAGMDLNNFNLHFSGQQNNSRVGIGTTCAAPLFAKFTVNENSGNSQGSITSFMINTNNSVTGSVFGVVSILNPTNPNILDIGYTAGFFVANGASKHCVGVEGRANGSISVSSANFGGYFVAQNGGLNVGVYAETPLTSPANYAAWFEGNILFNGALSGTNNVLTSDQMFKTNIDSIQGATQLILSLQPKSFYFDTLNTYGMNFDSQKQYGLIAQDVEQVLPELVGETYKPSRYDSASQTLYPAVTYKNLNYNALFGIMIQAMQEQQAQIQSQNNRIDSLQSQLSSCCSSSMRTQNPIANQTDVTLTNSQSVVLNQNVPNPFAEQTTITYKLPESVTKAQLLFYDATGKLIKAVDLTGRGEGQINVFANDLSNGIYSYALVVDGQIADTKRMVKTN
jgi:hypothetical protein